MSADADLLTECYPGDPDPRRARLLEDPGGGASLKRRQIAIRAAFAAILALGLLGDLPWDPLRQGLRDLGYVEGENVVFEDRRSGGRNERWPELAAKLVGLKVQVIVANGTPAVLAAKRATTTIPIVMAVTGDPLSTGLVASLARPGGNVTGLMQLGAGLAAKRPELLKELVPGISRLAFLWNPANPDRCPSPPHDRPVISSTSTGSSPSRRSIGCPSCTS